MKIIIFFLILFNIYISQSEEDINENIKERIITYGSTLRIQNDITKFYLSSFDMNWSTGSRLQIVTAVQSDKDTASLFTIKEGEEYPIKKTGEPVLCDDVIRLEHINTQRNLHSHDFKSFVTDSQEACAFGEGGYGDVNDNFRIVCYKQSGENKIFGKTQFFLQHVPTEKWLYINVNQSMYNDYNCRGCPIRGQREVSLSGNKDKQCLWQVKGGIIFNYENPEKPSKDDDNEELNTEDSL